MKPGEETTPALCFQHLQKVSQAVPTDLEQVLATYKTEISSQKPAAQLDSTNNKFDFQILPNP